VGKTGVLGAFEELVLLALLQQGKNAYGVSIRRELEERSGSDVTMGAVYATLDRLEDKGLVRPRPGEANESRRGRPVVTTPSLRVESRRWIRPDG